MSKVGIAVCLGPISEIEVMEAVESSAWQLTIKRRCVDQTQVLSAARAGLVSAVLLDAEYIEVDQEFLSELDRTDVISIVIGGEELLSGLTELPGIRFIKRKFPAGGIEKHLAPTDSQLIMSAIESLFVPKEP